MALAVTEDFDTHACLGVEAFRRVDRALVCGARVTEEVVVRKDATERVELFAARSRRQEVEGERADDRRPAPSTSSIRAPGDGSLARPRAA